MDVFVKRKKKMRIHDGKLAFEKVGLVGGATFHNHNFLYAVIVDIDEFVGTILYGTHFKLHHTSDFFRVIFFY